MSTHEDDDTPRLDSLVSAGSSSSPPADSPQAIEAPTRRVRSQYEIQIEQNERRDEVEPSFTIFNNERDLHQRQHKDLQKKADMIGNRIDKLNDEVERLRQQWGGIEREKTALLSCKERYEHGLDQKAKILRRDEVKAQKYQDYLTLAQEVLNLDSDDDDDDDEDADSFMYDWEAPGEDGSSGGLW